MDKDIDKGKRHYQTRLIPRWTKKIV